jgi:hypothetical protein
MSPRAPHCCVHNRLVVSSSPTSPTTQSCAIPVSCGLWKNLWISARFKPALPVSAAGEGRPTRQKCRPVSLMSFVKHRGHDWNVLHTCQREVDQVMDRAEERAGPEDVGDQTLIRGLDTALPFVRPGLSLSGIGRRSCDRPRRDLGSSPCRGPALTSARLMFDDGELLLARCYV